MELSENTLSLLKNFSGINQNILIRAGNTIKTITEARNVLASAEIIETFPNDVGIYDLNEFIGVLSLVDSPNLQFEDEYVKISDACGRSRVKYFFSAEETLTAPQKDINMPDPEVTFTLDNDTLNKIKKAAGALGHTEVAISGKNGVLNLSVIDTNNVTSNIFSIDVDGNYPENATFKFILNISNIKIIPGDYDVKISSKLISEFINKSVPVKYWIALEKSSTYGV